jgi:hypothetical protein
MDLIFLLILVGFLSVYQIFMIKFMFSVNLYYYYYYYYLYKMYDDYYCYYNLMDVK